MREIGSEFWDVPTTAVKTELFPNNTLWYISGRSALSAIIRDFGGCGTVALPSWVCESIVRPFQDEGIQVRYYPVYYAKGLVQEPRFDCDALLVMDYFGYTGETPDLSRYRGKVIRDVTHSLLSSDYRDADYYFGSLRKWCGVWTGGYAWTSDGHSLYEGLSCDQGYVSLREEAMLQKSRYIEGFTSSKTDASADKEFLRTFGMAENLLDNMGIKQATKRDIALAKKLDKNFIINRRRSNARILMEAFPEILIFPELKKDDCPMFVPILIQSEKRDSMRRYLVERGIYCPIHWPRIEYHKLDNCADATLYDESLSLVCDQRYTENDMYRIVDAVDAFWKEC